VARRREPGERGRYVTAPPPGGRAQVDLAPTFTIAHNPEPGSKLPYLLRLPLPDGPLLLKAADTWPRTSRIYCHPAESWPEPAQIVEEVPVRLCRRLGVAIDLVLDRPRENRSQLVFATIHGGRPAIFWQSPRTTTRARPGVRIPSRRASGHDELHILVDTRERYPYRFAGKKATRSRSPLPAGDYGVAVGGEIIAVVERKTLPDLAARLVDGGLAYSMAELATLPRAALVVEDRYSQLFKLAHVNAGWVADLLATVQVRYPAVPMVFCETRALAEEWTFRFLGAAAAFYGPAQQ
jgi:ERCC4 domain